MSSISGSGSAEYTSCVYAATDDFTIFIFSDMYFTKILTLGAPKLVNISLLHKAKAFDMRKLRKSGEVIVGAKLM